MPVQSHYQFDVRLDPAASLDEDGLRQLIRQQDFSIANFSYWLHSGQSAMSHKMVLRSSRGDSAKQLVQSLAALEGVLEYRRAPNSD